MWPSIVGGNVPLVSNQELGGSATSLGLLHIDLRSIGKVISFLQQTGVMQAQMVEGGLCALMMN
jgi:hypothetical protein